MHSLPTLAKSAKETQLETAEIREVRQGLAFGNTQGLDILSSYDQLHHDLLRERREFQQKMTKLEDRHQKLWELVREHEGRFQQNMTVTGDHRRTSDGYLDIRERFLEVFKRDVLKWSQSSSNLIAVGNARAHAGDCIVDAELYRLGRRDDEDTMIRLYGMSSMKIQELCKSQTHSFDT